MNILAPIFLILASVGIFYGYTNPRYRGEDVPANIVNLMNERKQYTKALKDSNSLIEERNRLVEINNSLSDNDLERLKKLLPDHIDNVRLIIDIDEIASKYGFNIRNIKIGDDANVSGELGPNTNPYGVLTLQFNVTATYDRFRSFINDMQKSLRVVDIVGISFNSTDTGNYDYNVTIKTYWIK